MLGHRPVELRRAFHCGWLERSEWTRYSGPTQFGMGMVKYAEEGEAGAVCPGYVITQPCVWEAIEAAAVPDGEVGDYYPGGEGTILAARLVAKDAQNVFQLARMRQQELKGG